MVYSQELHLVVPGICGPLADIQPLKSSSVVKNWIKVLSRASSSPSSLSVYDVLGSLFGLSIDGDFPIAALRMLASGQYEKSMNCMCADPVHLQADMDHAILTSSFDLAISDTESAALYDALNQHFNQDGLNFIRTGANNWVITASDRIQMKTTPLDNAVGRNVNFILPRGESSSYWKQVLTEAQMLMHSHEVNMARENRGQQSVNSLWFYGSGKLPEINNCRITGVCSNNEILKGLASHVQCDYLPLSDSVSGYADMLLSGNSTVNLLHLPELEQLVNYSDLNLWLAAFTEALMQWVYPLIKMANKNNIKLFLYPCNDKQYQFSRYDTVKFWRLDKLEQHIRAY